MAHNLARWTSRLCLGESLIATDTLRRRYLGDPRPAHLLGRKPILVQGRDPVVGDTDVPPHA